MKLMCGMRGVLIKLMTLPLRSRWPVLLPITVQDFHLLQPRRLRRRGRLLRQGHRGAPRRLSLLLWISPLQIYSLWLCPAQPQLLLYPHVRPPALQFHSTQRKIYNIIFKNIFCTTGMPALSSSREMCNNDTKER